MKVLVVSPLYHPDRGGLGKQAVLLTERLADLANPSFVGRRQQHLSFAARTAVEFAPRAAGEEAGLALVQNADFHFRLIATQAAGDRRT